MKKEKVGWLLLVAGLVAGAFSSLMSVALLIVGAVFIVLSTTSERE